MAFKQWMLRGMLHLQLRFEDHQSRCLEVVVDGAADGFIPCCAVFQLRYFCSLLGRALHGFEAIGFCNDAGQVILKSKSKYLVQWRSMQNTSTTQMTSTIYRRTHLLEPHATHADHAIHICPVDWVLRGELSKIDCRNVLHPGSKTRQPTPCQSMSVCRCYIWDFYRFWVFGNSKFTRISSQLTLNRFGAQGLDEGHQGRMFLLKGPQWLSGSGFHQLQQQRGEDFLQISRALAGWWRSDRLASSTAALSKSNRGCTDLCNHSHHSLIILSASRHV